MFECILYYSGVYTCLHISHSACVCKSASCISFTFRISEEEQEIEGEEESEREKGRREGEEEVKLAVSSAAAVVTAAANATAIVEDLGIKTIDTTAVDTAAKTSDPVAATSADLTTAATATRRHLKQKPKLRRRVSWADDARPLYTIIPDDTSEQVCVCVFSWPITL